MNTKTIKHFSLKAIPFMILALIVSLLGGSFFGRINTITCNKKTNTCTIVSKGYLYTVYREEFPMDEIISTHVQLIKDPAPEEYGKKSRPPLNYYSLIIERGMTKPLKVIPNAEVPVHDIFNYSVPIFQTSRAMNEYLEDPNQNEATFTFGTHRTGVLFTFTIFGFLFYFIYLRSTWTLSYSITRDRVTMDFLGHTGNDQFVGRTAYHLTVNRGKSPLLGGIIYMIEGSSIVIENKQIKIKHPFRKKPEKIGLSDIPKGMPEKFKDELLSLKA